MGRYPDGYEIEEIFSKRGNPDEFHKHLAEGLDVVVVGQDWHIGGNYNNKEKFHEGIYARVAAGLKIETIRVEIIKVIGGGDSSWAAVESKCTAESKYGRPYHLEFVDLVRFNSEGKIAQMKEFLDSAHIHGHVEEHESKTKGPTGSGTHHHKHDTPKAAGP